ncbi:MAG: hypothetical protein HN337_03340 [Deltaproteobacteria bacterium]|jgi:hypothetical protein|nr:hypothetical protein [Deltaproteobacteria bacterium]
MAYEYLFSALPVLPERLGDKVSIEPRELWQIVKAEGGVCEFLSQAILYANDIKSLERSSMGLEAQDGAIHSKEELQDKSQLPSWLHSSLMAIEREKGGYEFRKVWTSYYENLFAVADLCGCSFLNEWTCWDLGFRDALAQFRAHLEYVDVSYDGIDYFEGHPPASEYKPIVEALVSLKERGSDQWRDMDKLIGKNRIEKARQLAPGYQFDLNELISYVIQYTVFKEFEYLQEGVR